MGSNYYGEAKLGSSSRKGKKNRCSDKPKQPQRGLGVAQLEKIRQMGCANYIPNPLPNPNYPFTNPIQEDVRVQTAYSSASSSSFSYTTPASSSYGFQAAQNMIMMDLGHSERANVRYNDSQSTTNNIARWNAGNTILNPQYYQQPYITRNLIDLEAEELIMEKKKKKKKGRGSDSMGSGSQNSGSSGSQELDLELRLSL